MKRTAFYTSALFSMLLSSAAWAQETVPVRAGQHDGYTRLVFDWSTPTNYTVTPAGQTLSVAFDKAATLDTSKLSAGGFVTAVTPGTAAGKLVVSIGMQAGSTFRTFKTGDNVIVDILNKSPAKASVKTPVATPPVKAAAVPAPTPAQKKDEKAAELVPAPIAAPLPAAASAESVAVSAAAPIPAGEEKLPPIEPHTITLSSTQPVGMAAFVRGNKLWMVVDNPLVKVPPQIIGPRINIFSPFKRIELENGLAYVTTMPSASYNVYGEGSGLIWRLIVTPKERNDRGIEPRVTSPSDKTAMRGSSLFWPFKTGSKIIKITDPDLGDTIHVLTVKNSTDFAGVGRDYVDFEELTSPIGIAIKSKVDDLELKTQQDGLRVTRLGGLAVARKSDISQSMIRKDIKQTDVTTEPVVDAPVPDATAAAETTAVEEEKPFKAIFDLPNWQMGGIQALQENQRLMIASMANKDKDEILADLLTLAKMNLANDRGPEALGFLSYAQAIAPSLADGVEFTALHGAANALSGKYELALIDFNTPALKEYTELDYWRSYVLAWLEDWQQAEKILPKDTTVLLGYPQPLLEKMGIKLAEVALRSAKAGMADNILSAMEKNRDNMWLWTQAGIDYLQGESLRQKGEIEKVVPLWEKLIEGKDDFYRARAGLAMTLLELQSGKMDRAEAIDRLEGLRYAWRGDELESRINYTVAKLYLEDRRYLKAFSILRDVVSMNPTSGLGREMQAFMQERFINLIMNDKDLSPVDAVTVFEEFSDLNPPGDAGNKLIEKLSDRLLDADLLDRAGTMLQGQVDKKLEGLEKGRVALRLSAIYLLNDKPELAMKSLEVARTIYAAQAPEIAAPQIRKIDLMHARALSEMDKPAEALRELNEFEPSPDINRLRADIAWQAGMWEEAASALQDLILDHNLDSGNGLNEDQADILLNRAVALSLSDNRVALANMRQRYMEQMDRTPRGKLFEVITRPRQSAVLQDRDTLQSLVTEVDIFRDFLESYRASDITQDEPAPAPAPATAPPAQ